MPPPTSTETRTFIDTTGDQTKVVTITVESYDPCYLTFAHTQNTCGHPGCRTR